MWPNIAGCAEVNLFRAQVGQAPRSPFPWEAAAPPAPTPPAPALTLTIPTPTPAPAPATITIADFAMAATAATLAAEGDPLGNRGVILFSIIKAKRIVIPSASVPTTPNVSPLRPKVFFFRFEGYHD